MNIEFIPILWPTCTIHRKRLDTVSLTRLHCSRKAYLHVPRRWKKNYAIHGNEMIYSLSIPHSTHCSLSRVKPHHAFFFYSSLSGVLERIIIMRRPACKLSRNDKPSYITFCELPIWSWDSIDDVVILYARSVVHTLRRSVCRAVSGAF